MNTTAATTRRDLRPMHKSAPCSLLELSSATRSHVGRAWRYEDEQHPY